MASSKKKPVKFKFEVPKEYRELVKEFGEFRYNPPEPNPFYGHSMIKELAGEWKEEETKDPIKDWVERWLENEKSNSRI